jgi:hypothetical protein
MSSRGFGITIGCAALFAIACVFPTSICGCTPPIPYWILVAGSVTTADGAPAVGAPVRVRAYDGACPAIDSAWSGSAAVVTDGDGNFRIPLGSSTRADSACIRVGARFYPLAPPALPPPEAIVQIPNRRIGATTDGHPIDSVVSLKLTLPAR